ncbi:MAG: SpoIIE family protein phosphatase [Leptospirales bacterium]|nr:SpoIIE family protein phosphatase [Leptospirales bacterium]
MDLHELLTTIMDTAKGLLEAEAASLLLYDAESEELIFDIARGAGGAVLARRRIPVSQGVAGLCVRERQAFVINDAQSDSRILRDIDQSTGFQTRNLLATPMVANGQVIGVLEALNTADRRDFSGGDLRLLNYLSNMAALAIRNRRLFDETQERVNELNCVFEISQSAQKADSLDGLLQATLDAIGRVLGVERLSVLFREEGERGLRLARTRGFNVEDRDFRIDPETGIAGIVLKTGDPLLVRDVEKELRIHSDRAGLYSTRSFISVPIKVEGRLAGLLNAADKTNGEPFDYFELKVLSTAAAQIADACSRMRSRERALEIQMYRKDLDTAAQIQRNSLPRIPARIGGHEVATRYEACREVGGDFYDLIYHSPDRISLLIADVAGKGVPAALFMEYSKTLIGGQIPRNLDPVATLARANDELYRNSKIGIFVTCMLLQVEREHRRIRMASAGHNRQYLYRPRQGEIEVLSGKGAPLGIFEGMEYLERLVQYEPGDLLVLYTDGITEANDRRFGEYGEERLIEVVRQNGALPPDGIIRAIFDDVDRFRDGFEANDDATMMVVRLA